MATYGFLQFPPEVRNQIYEYLYISPYANRRITPDPKVSRRRSGLVDEVLR